MGSLDATMTFSSIIPALAVSISLLAAVLIVISSRSPNLREFWTLAAATGKFLLILTLLPAVLAGNIAVSHVLEISPGITLSLQADPLGVFFALIASLLWIVTSVYSIGYVRGVGEKNQTRYFASFAVCLSSTIGIAFSANLVTFVIFYEMLTLATYPLVIHKETPEAISSGRKYLAYTLTAGILLIVATAWTYNVIGSVDFVEGGLFRGEGVNGGTIRLLFSLFILGVGVKAGIMPLHGWLPAAMVAPTPVSALLHAVAVVKSGVFGVVRVCAFVFGPDVMREEGLNIALSGVACITIVTASLIAFKQDNLKRLLAYSTVGHLSYIVLGAALISPGGLAGGMFHMVSHAFLKITLFFCAGAIYATAHLEKISDMDGIGRSMPWTMGAFTLGAIGLAGIPPMNGFLSKWYLVGGAGEAGDWIAFSVLLVSGLLNAGYFFPVVYRAFFRAPGESLHKGDATLFMLIPLLLTALISILLGILPDIGLHFHELSFQIMTSIFGTS